MLDQDAECAILETETVLAARRSVGTSLRARVVRARGLAARWAAPAMVIAGLALASQSVFRLDLVPGATERAVASAGGFRAALFRDPLHDMPAGLQAYEADQYANFVRGIVRFSDSDLLEYAATTARDLRGIGGPMTPFLMDVLWLTNREIERRSLSPATTLL